MPSDEVTERMIRAGLVPGVAPQQNMVTIIDGGQERQVPADVGTYMAVSTLIAAIQQLVIRLDSLHAHAAAGSHPKSKAAQSCLMCKAEQITPEQAKKIREAMEAEQNGEPPAHTVDADVQDTQEEQ